ncbi:hypothetical protein GN956_G25832 [Arapaima gigas]
MYRRESVLRLRCSCWGSRFSTSSAEPERRHPADSSLLYRRTRNMVTWEELLKGQHPSYAAVQPTREQYEVMLSDLSQLSPVGAALRSLGGTRSGTLFSPP